MQRAGAHLPARSAFVSTFLVVAVFKTRALVFAVLRDLWKELAPRARFELATLRLTAECSTVELPGNGQARRLFYNTMH